MTEPFFFCVCQPGSERILKAEVARWRPEARSAFGRPGLVTFKGVLAPDEVPPLVFSRLTGVSRGPARTVEEVAAHAGAVSATRLHLWDREGGAAPTELHDRLIAAFPFRPGVRPVNGETVLDIAVHEDEPWFIGMHVHSPKRTPFPGGLIPIEVPPDAPSRAYGKLEEALVWSGLTVRAGEIAVEIGSAPGGAAHALLRRGLQVVGVDPGEMDPLVAGHPAFRHVKKPIGETRRDDLPARADWLLLDVNLAPQVALHSIRRIVSFLRGGLRGAIFTLKLNEEAFAAEVPAFLERVAGMGLKDVRATQLPSNRREICVVATAR